MCPEFLRRRGRLRTPQPQLTHVYHCVKLILSKLPCAPNQLAPHETTWQYLDQQQRSTNNKQQTTNNKPQQRGTKQGSKGSKG